MKETGMGDATEQTMGRAGEVFEIDSSRPKVTTESKPRLLIGGLWLVELNPKNAATFKVSS
jgi:hypothetical protein